MRKIFAGILLAFTLPAMADIAADLNNGMSPAAALGKAKAECAPPCDATKQALLIEEMIKAGVPPEAVAQAARINTIQADAVVAGMNNAMVEPAKIQAASNIYPEMGHYISTLQMGGGGTGGTGETVRTGGNNLHTPLQLTTRSSGGSPGAQNQAVIQPNAGQPPLNISPF